MKVFFRNIHLYLSLAAGLVIMACCFSGAVLVFEKELQEITNRDRYFVNPGKIQLPIEQLVKNVKQQYPAAKISGVKIYPDPKRSVEVSVFMGGGKGENAKGGRKENVQASESKQVEGTEQKGKGGRGDKGKQQAGGGGGRPTHTVFVNPYTGQVLDLYSYRETFYYTMFALHRWLLGSESSIGKTITGVSTLIFLFIIITGIILWWPRNKAILKQRLKIKTDASFKRVNHDLHVVLGFYSAIFLFIFSFTALAWSFKWFNKGIYTVTKSSMESPKPPASIIDLEGKRISYDSAFITITKKVPDAQFYNLRAPSDSTGTYVATVLPVGAHESAADNYYIDQYTGKIVGSLLFADKNLGQRVRATFKPVHVGSIYGMPSKIIAFLSCVLGVTFPITGVIMWINRLNKNKRRKKQVAQTGAVAVAANDADYED